MLSVVDLGDGCKLIVEAEDIVSVSEGLAEMLNMETSAATLPRGAEQVSATKVMNDAAVRLKGQIACLGELAREAIASARPSEIEIQACVKFAGSANPIPFLVSTKGEGGLKLTLKWSEGDAKRQTVGASNEGSD